MNSIILEDVKKQVGDFYDGDHFDIDLVIHINTALFILNQMGIGIDGFAITLTGEEKWSDFLKSSQLNLHAIKSWVYLKVRMIFDPPTSSIVKESFESCLKEFEWRMYITENYVGEV